MKNKNNRLEATKRYRKTPKGVLTNMYDKMRKRHKVEFTLKEFHLMYLNDDKFLRLHREWLKSGCNKKLKPSIDRINCKKHYSKNNIQMMTWEENRFKQSKFDGKRGTTPPVLLIENGKVVKRFNSQRHVVKEMGMHQGNLSLVLNGKNNTVSGHKFIYETNYENKELLNEQKTANIGTDRDG